MAQQRKSGRPSGGQILGDLQGKLKSVTGGGGGSSWFDWVWIGGALIAGLVLMTTSFTAIEPGQVAVRINNVTGGLVTVTQPGWITRLPFGIHSVYVLDASPQTFSMHGSKTVDDLEVSELTVRASDGSNFHFSDTTIIFQIAGDEAQTVIRDGGEERGYLKWMRPYARAILRDEFGRESTISVSNPTKFGEATERAKSRLNELLGVHGVIVTQIVTPRPQFNDEYEKLIEERNKLGNQLEVIKSNLAAAETSRERRLAEVNRDQNRQIQEKRTELESALATAIAAQADATREADTYKISKVAEGQAALSAAKQQAAELRGQLEAVYRARKAEIDAFRSQPVERVMERLGERLRGVTIAIEPWANDANPSRVEVEKIGGAQ
ncbi:membrane protease subunit HflC [Nannocystis exedens]|uniref:Membrane protease subunit HflC n=1 Tax=Nannocystis exedens TaxID=54 RepID=A0A1I1T975_9BACT|nr:SPFH domain-containing protein [Nannocystis exedens]PCC66703.1 SPFH domain / Band 7 family protein [Nannocystis exedens]SFD55146.1 membrane protease subunit HflC [Nannocystis exedens]